MDRKRGGGGGGGGGLVVLVCGWGQRRRKGRKKTLGEPNKVQSVVMGSQDLSRGKSESKTRRWKSWRGGERR